MKRSLFYLVAILLLSFTKAGEDPLSASVTHQSQLFDAVFKTVNQHFVDSLDPATLNRVAIDAMLRSLDPYSVYYDSIETKEREKTWRGQLYAGIGAGVAFIDSSVVITEPYEGYGAHASDLRTGDRIYSVDDKIVKGLSFEHILKLLRGEPGTYVELAVERPASGIITRKIQRQQIFTKSILFTGLIDETTGYINVSQFLKESDTQFRTQVIDLKGRGAKTLVIDLRDNIGGLVQEAVNCLACFLPKGTKVCSLKGKFPSANYEYFTDIDPVDTLMKLVILTNNVTVSSGEIFTGALQDLDRAVIIGERTFGKGLVQGTRFTGYGTSVYLTAARYYTPSGRSIQELDYSSKYRNNNVKKFPANLKHEFKTKNGRKVFSIGGIEPDIKISYKKHNEIVQTIAGSKFYSDYLNKYRNRNDLKVSPATFQLPKDFKTDFINHLMSDKVLNEIPISAESDLNTLIRKLQNDDLYPSVSNELEQVRSKLNKQKKKIISASLEAILRQAEKDLVLRYSYRSGVFKYNFHHDPEIIQAREILIDSKKYSEILKKS